MKPRLLSPRELAERIDYAVLHDPTPERLEEAVREAEELGLRAITTYFTALQILEGITRRVKIAVVIDFPSGASHIEAKVKATEQAIAHGADEVEFVVNIWWWLRGHQDYLINEVRALATIARNTGVVSKAIIESSFLTPQQLREILEAISTLPPEERPDYIKMNTGWFKRGVRPYEVRLAAGIVKKRGMGVKAAGGIRDAYTASLLVELGADIIGSSRPRELIEDAERSMQVESILENG